MAGQRTQARTQAKLAACDPCRFAKLACDHAKPTCGRCQRRDAASDCTYRPRPFKKKQLVQKVALDAVQKSQLPNQGTADPQEFVVARSHHYPNPGYLGLSSHATIFRQLPPALHDETDGSQSAHEVGSTQGLEAAIEDDQVIQGAKLIEDILKTPQVKLCRVLVDDWITIGGVNLALAGSLVSSCAQSAEHTLTQLNESIQTCQELSMKLFVNSRKSIVLNEHANMDDFLAGFCGENIRWEALGLFFTAISRATLDMSRFTPLYRTEQQRKALRRNTMRYADRCLDFGLSLDCLNDLQLMLQYENFINHSCVDGDQSYRSWKRLGDVISSVFALGYHEKIDLDGDCPAYLKHLRQAAVARIYSADKNVSIFLGRPPRMNSRYCTFNFVNLPQMDTADNESATIRYLGWNVDDAFDYMTDTWWSFECALLKEEIMHLQHEADFVQKMHKAGAIRSRVELLWTRLPAKYQYSGDLRLPEYDSIDRDFVASARLNYLHALFLLRLQLARHVSEQDDELLSVSAEVLHIVAQAAVMKDRLSFSGTGLIWKICHYGLPSTGILCLSLLKPLSSSSQIGSSRASIVQDLSVLVAQVNTGILIDSADPNYALLSAATQTIQAILNKALSSSFSPSMSLHQQLESVSNTLESANIDWLPWSSDNNWDFEMDFWTNLAEHPILIADEMVG